MKVLIIGESNKVTNGIVAKMNKEGHKVYTLSETKNKKYRRVYERYYFDYGNNSIKDVFESVTPDLTIFAAAYDTAYDWDRQQDEFLKYSTALNNMLNAYARVGRGRFVYLSSEEVYNANVALEDLPEYVGEGGMYKSKAVRQGEITCVNYKVATGLDVVVLRIENISYTPDNLSEIVNVCGRMCVETVNAKELHSTAGSVALLSLADAVTFMYTIFTAEKHRYDIYKIASEDELWEHEMIDIINREFEFRVPVKYENAREYLWLEELEVHDYREEFPYELFHKSAECAQEIAAGIHKNQKQFLVASKTEANRFQQILASIRHILIAFIPFIENLILFIPFFMMNNRAVGSQFFGKLDSYLLYVLLFAIVYGQQQATFSAILSVAGYIFRQMYTKSGFEVAIDYNTYVWMAQLLILGLAVGYLRDQLILVRRDKDDEIEYLKHRLVDIEKINKSNVRVKNDLEQQVINQSDSMGKIYAITSTLDKYEPEEVLFYAAEVVSSLMGSGDVAIYTVSNDTYARLVSFTSAKAKTFGRSVEYKAIEPLYSEIAADRIFINRKMEPTLPMMAMGIQSEGELKLIVLIWELPYERMTLSQANRLKVIGALTQNSIVRANYYMNMLASQRYIAGTHVMEEEAFRSLVKAFVNAKKKNLTECVFVQIDTRGAGVVAAGLRLEKSFRSTDYLGDLGDGNLYLLLVSTDAGSVAYVRERITEAGYYFAVHEEIGI